MFAKLSTFVTFIAFSNALSLRLAAPEVTSCLEGTENFVENISVNIQPWPVHVATGATLSIDGGLTILDAIVEGSQLKLDLSLVTALGNLPIPCLPIDGLEIGSCTYPIQRLLDDALELGVCELFLPEGQDCSLPLNPGSYAPGTEALEVTIPDIPAVLEPFLKGKINAKLIGIIPDGTEIVCLETTLELN
eukprot:09909.XXX_599589_598912_1 [CDS] Oithona nana genome sequencing.